MIAIAYSSTAAHKPTRQDLEALLLDARHFNASVEVTGALLLHEATFLQYFEGPKLAVEKVYARIKASSLHYGIVELMCDAIGARYFDHWHMGFAEAPSSALLEFSNDAWRNFARSKSLGTRSLGFQVLLDFWQERRDEM